VTLRQAIIELGIAETFWPDKGQSPDVPPMARRG
jgi:hypothetical protein